jgi:hypothetical protein
MPRDWLQPDANDSITGKELHPDAYTNQVETPTEMDIDRSFEEPPM